MIMVTGSTGFVGRHIVQAIAASGSEVLATYRNSPRPEWSGSSHIKSCKVDSLDSTRVLAEQAAKNGVRRLVFLSSIAVYGSIPTGVLRENQELFADSEYGNQKLEAEKALFEVAKDSGLEVVVVRPPLIYGDGAPGNFGLLRRIVGKGIPLPFASIDNRRSFLSVFNLVDFILLCTHHSGATGKAFVICDDETVSTSEFLQLVGEAIGKPARLFWLPNRFVYWIALLTGKGRVYGQLYGNLEIEMSQAKTVLAWRPPFSMRESLARSFSTGVIQ